jgi:hypothetical protein
LRLGAEALNLSWRLRVLSSENGVSLDGQYVEVYGSNLTPDINQMQKGKIDLARQRMPIARDRSLGNPLANRITLPLLEVEKRWLFLQLARELP